MHLRRGCMPDYSRRHLRNLTSWLVSPVQPIACDLLAFWTEHYDDCDLRGIGCFILLQSSITSCLPMYRVHFRQHGTANSNWLACCTCTLSIRPTTYLYAVTLAIFPDYSHNTRIGYRSSEDWKRPSIIDLRIDGDDIQPPLEREHYDSSELFPFSVCLIGQKLVHEVLQ